MAVLFGASAFLWNAPAGQAADAANDAPPAQAQILEEGEAFYKGKCIICHGKGGGRGPNLFATKLNDEQFLYTVTNGRKGTLMPVFGLRLSPDDIMKIRAFLKAHPNGL